VIFIIKWVLTLSFFLFIIRNIAHNIKQKSFQNPRLLVGSCPPASFTELTKKEIIIQLDEGNKGIKKMNFFQITNQVNQNKNLNWAEKAILNQIIGFNLNDQDFIATNKWLADYWGVDISTIKRILASLAALGYIQTTVIKKKHTTGDKQWYNKRYITANIDNMTKNEVAIVPSDNLEPESTVTETISKKTIETTEPIVFDYPENEDGDLISDEFFNDAFDYNQIVEPAPAPKMSIIDNAFELEYNFVAALQLVKSVEHFRNNCLERFGRLNPDEKYLRDVLEYVQNHKKEHIETYLGFLNQLKQVA